MLIQIQAASRDSAGTASITLSAMDPIASDITVTIRQHGAGGITYDKTLVMQAGARTQQYTIYNFGWVYQSLSIIGISPTSDDSYHYVYDDSLVPIENPELSNRFEVGITNNSTGAPVSVTLQGGESEISTEDVPIGGSVWSGWAEQYVNGIVNLRHDYASGDYFYVGVHREDGSTGWIVCEWSESGASTALNGYLTIYEHANDNEVQVIVNNNVDGYIPEGTFGALNIELNDGQRISVIFEHHPNL